MPQRCPWLDLRKPDYVAYHDTEWGVPLHDDQKQFEFLILEGAQAGLSWYTILRRRDNYRAAFADFDPVKVAGFSGKDIERLMLDAGIIRNRLKITSAVTNAEAFLRLQEEEGSFSRWFWSFVGGKLGKSLVPKVLSDYRASSPESEKASKALKDRGFKFVGPTIVYAHMQATGLFNDHSCDCFRRKEIPKVGR